MNKKFLALIITLAALQPGTSSCMWGIVSNLDDISSDPNELLTNFGIKIDQEKIKLEEEFNKLWDRVENLALKWDNSNRLNKEEIKQLAEIFKKITPEKNPEIIKRLKKKSSGLVKKVLSDAITHGVTSVIKNFIGNAMLFDAVIENKKEALQAAFGITLEKKRLELIKPLIKLEAEVKQNALITLLKEQTHKGMESFGGVMKFGNGSSFFLLRDDDHILIDDDNISKIDKKRLKELRDAAELLVKKGADINATDDATGTTVLRFAIRLFYSGSNSKEGCEAADLIKFLLEAGADPEKTEWHRIFTALNERTRGMPYPLTEEEIKIRNVTLPELIDILAHFPNIPWSTIIKENDFLVFIRMIIRLGKPDVAKQIYDKTDDLRKEEKNKIYTNTEPRQEWVKALENAKNPLNFFFKYLAEEALKLAKEAKNEQEKKLYLQKAKIFLRAAHSEKGINPAEIEKWVYKNPDFYEFCSNKGKNHWNFDIIGYKNNLKDLANILPKYDGEIITAGAAKLLLEKDKKNTLEFELVSDELNALLNNGENNKKDNEQNNDQNQPKKILPPCTTIGKVFYTTKNSKSSDIIVRPDVKIFLADQNQE